MAAKERKYEALLQQFRADCGARNTGVDHPDVAAWFDEIEAALEALLRDAAYAGGVRSGDWWDVVYQATAISCGTITLRTEGPGNAAPGLYVTDPDAQRTFHEHALKAWIEASVDDMFYSAPRTGGASDAYARRIPWKKISMVHRETGKNMHTLIGMHKSHLAKRQRADAEGSPPAKRVCPPPAESPETRAQLTLEVFVPAVACAAEPDEGVAALEAEIADYRRQIAALELAAGEAELAQEPQPACARRQERRGGAAAADLARLQEFLRVGARLLASMDSQTDAEAV